jgi:UDP-sugar pyrophosphorylase
MYIKLTLQKFQDKKNIKIMINETNCPPNLYKNLNLLNEDEIILAKLLLELNQHHLFEYWDDIGINDNLKHNFFNQIQKLHQNYKVPGGLAAYINQSKILLSQSKNSFNPLDGWIPHIPIGVTLDPLSSSYIEYEELGKNEIGNCGFILVAGGLGERLGYSGIKIELPIEMITEKCYLDFYCTQILNIQKKYLTENSLLKYLPFAIMVSDDTINQTLLLLEKNNYFGLLKEQITILKQEKVASISTSEGDLALATQYELLSKPHGHGDVHSLMYSSGTAQNWNDIGIKHCLFFQDTNALAFNGLLSFIGN